MTSALHWLAFVTLGVFTLLGDSADRVRRAESTEIRAVRESPMLHVGEELEYRVSYSFFTIGTIRFKVTDREEQGDRVIYRAYVIIDSNPALSWLTDVHIRFYNEMDNRVFSHVWIGDDSTSKGVDYRKIEFDYPKNVMYFSKGKKDTQGARKPYSVDTVAVSGLGQDGLSLFFYAREHVHEQRKASIPTFIENKEVTTVINFLNERTDMDIDAVDYPVDVVHFDGRADFVGVFGLTGGFEGWFSNDEESIPITARMKVILGSIKVELTKWKRGNWVPPKFPEEK